MSHLTPTLNVRQSLADTLFASRLDRLFARLASPRGIVLAMHRLAVDIDSGPLGGLCVSLEEFRHCLDLLEHCGFEVVSMSEAMARLDRADGGPKFAVLTFDDGYRDNYDLLLPELMARRIQATIYLTTGFVDRTAPMWWYGIENLHSVYGTVTLDGAETRDFATLHAKLLSADSPDRLRTSLDTLGRRYGVDFSGIAAQHAMDWSMVRELAATGLVEIGAHGINHLPLSRLDEDPARREMEVSAARIRDEIGRNAAHFAYPYGDRGSVTTRDVALARRCGFETATTSISGLVRSPQVNRHALRRVVLGGTGMLDRLRLSLAGLTGDRPIAGPG
jgi:peptidoglycan/xylan/chitin deacetylase (PgdA/CDA1 family)